MLGPIDDRTPPMTPQLALRVAMIGGVALLLFAIIFFRLWFLQVLSGSKYVAEAQSNHTAYVTVAAPRGEIVDSSGAALVTSVPVPSVQIAPRSLPAQVLLDGALKLPVVIPAKDDAVFTRLAKLLGMSTKPHHCTYRVYWTHGAVKYTTQLATIPCRIAESVAQAQYANVAIKTNVPTYIQDYIQERITEYPGVLTQDTYIRKYALGSAGAQVIGSLGEITEKELEAKTYKGVQSGDVVGQSGLEAEYNQYLKGINGSDGVKVNSQGQFEGYAKNVARQEGDTLKLSLNAQLERVGQSSLEHSIQLNSGTSGAFVAMDPQNGQIYAMGSAPSYNPSSVSPTISPKELKFLDNPDNNEPLINRAIDAPLPDGSTFKVITATAALESGKWSLGDIYDDDAKFCFQGGLCLQNSGDEHYGAIDLQTAIEVSDDEFFYNLGDKMEGNPADYPGDAAKDWPLQYWASKFGIGRTTGVDLPDEANGEIGSPKLQAQLWKEELQCQNATGPFAYTDSATGQISSIKLPGYARSAKVATVMDDNGENVVSGGCAIASSKYWAPGDNVNTGVGQYDDQVTPLQLAVVYAAIENGGKIVTPHLATAVDSAAGAVVQSLDPAARRKLNIDPAYLQAIQQGLHLAATGSGGTSTDVMGDFPKPVYGKTGTAELGDSAYSPEHAWYVCYVPASATNKPIVIAVNVEKGGFGDVAAAPVARQILSQWFLGKPGPYVGGSAAGDQT
jgi:penicillin-binding protein 2